MQFTPRSVTVQENSPFSVVSYRVEAVLETNLNSTLFAKTFTAPSSYPVTFDISSDAAPDGFYQGAVGGEHIRIRVVEIGHDGVEVPSAWDPTTYVVSQWSADGPESFTVNS
jgi:hypothetical protein